MTPGTSPWSSPGQNAGLGSCAFVQGGSSQPRDWTQVSHIAGGFFPSWATRKPTKCSMSSLMWLPTADSYARSTSGTVSRLGEHMVSVSQTSGWYLFCALWPDFQLSDLRAFPGCLSGSFHPSYKQKKLNLRPLGNSPKPMADGSWPMNEAPVTLRYNNTETDAVQRLLGPSPH